MAVNLIAQPLPRYYRRQRAAARPAVPMIGLLAACVAIALLVCAYVTLSSRVSAASARVDQLQGQLRSEQVHRDQLRMEIAELRSLDRLVKVGAALNMRPARPDRLSFVPMPAFASGNQETDATGLAASRAVTGVVAHGRAGSIATPTTVNAQMASVPAGEPSLWDHLLQLIRPGSASAGASDYPLY